MAQHKSAKKRIRQTAKKNLRNKAAKSKMRTMIKKFLKKVEDKVDVKTLQDEFTALQSTIAKVVQKGIIKKNTGSRYISNLAKKIKPTETKKQSESKKSEDSSKTA